MMTDREYKLVIAALLFDVGKIVPSAEHSSYRKRGYELLKDEVGITDRDILDAIQFSGELTDQNTEASHNSLAYILSIADRIATCSDSRGQREEVDRTSQIYPVRSIFNFLNGNHEELHYHPGMLDEEINYPTSQKEAFGPGFYDNASALFKSTLSELNWKEESVNRILETLEDCCSFYPAFMTQEDSSDISLYDQAKMRAAIGSCLYQYLEEQQEQDYRKALYENAEAFFDEKAFLLASIDISGIQSFIYTIQSKDALKMLRARSFYLEILTEHMLDSLLERLSLTRANKIYSGGGHAYLLFPNTERVRKEINSFEEELKDWFLKTFDVALYVGLGTAPFSANALKNMPEGSYSEIFRTVSREISEKKMSRYRAEDIVKLNTGCDSDYRRECSVCRRVERVGKDGLCDICSALKYSSKGILYDSLFIVTKKKTEGSLPLPGDCYLTAGEESDLKTYLLSDEKDVVRAYAKNRSYTGLKKSSRIWVGNYTKGQTFDELAERSIKNGRGIERLGVLRADVDNLGRTFISGFDPEHNTLVRTAALSRHLMLFFKKYVNHLLEGYNATIVYSGGDDVFLVGAWDEIMKIAVLLSDEFTKYTQGTLSISAGEGIYRSGYPVHQMALEVGELEDESKHYPGKKAFTILPDGESHSTEQDTEILISDGTYSWAEFKDRVLGQKLVLLQEFFEGVPERGSSFLYHLLELIRNRKEKINFARYVYLISRLEPSEKEEQEKKDLYRKFSKQMYEWMKDPKDCRELKTAITLYSYLTREKEGEINDH